MDRTEAVGQAFVMAYNGYVEATFEIERVRTSTGLHKLYDMRTFTIVVEAPGGEVTDGGA